MTLPAGEVITVSEIPEYITENNRHGFSRVFTTSNVPDQHEVVVNTSFEHLRGEQDLETDGQWLSSSFSMRDFNWGSSLKYHGTLKLNPNGSTYLRAFFEDQAAAHVAISKDTDKASDIATTQDHEAKVMATDGLSELVSIGKDIIGQK